MSVTEINYSNFNDAEGGLSVRTKLNALGNSVANLSQETKAIDDIVSINDIVAVGTESTLAKQTLVEDTAEKLSFIDDTFVTSGTSITVDEANDEITVISNGVYSVSGVITFIAPINDVVQIELYLNGVATGFLNSSIGRGNGLSCTVSYVALRQLSANDEITLYVKSNGVEVTIDNATLIIEKTKY